jgi:arabinofuranan 3-O-arabinosyltransferase
VVDGWQQGFVVPAGAAGTLEARFGPDTTYRLGLLLGFMALLGLLLAGALWRRGQPVRHQPAAAPTLGSRVALVALWAVLFAGLWGITMGVVAAGVVLLVGRRIATAITVMTGLVGTGLLAWFGPRPLGDGLSDVLPQVVLLLVILLAMALAAGPDLTTRFLPRRQRRE